MFAVQAEHSEGAHTYGGTVTDKPVGKTEAAPNCLFDRQLNHISRNNGALNLLHVPWRVPEGVAG